MSKGISLASGGIRHNGAGLERSGLPNDTRLPAPPEAPEGYEAFRLERRGIELVPAADRQLRPAGLFWMWAGAIWNVEFLVYGALILSFGLSFGQAVAAIVVGNLSYAFLGLSSLAGPDTGTTTFAVSRAAFGPNGNRLPALFNWITQVGFEIEGIVLIVLIVETMFGHEGSPLGDAGKAATIVVAVAVQFVVPFLGHATITRVLKYLSYLFIVVFAVMAVLVIPKADLGHLHQHSSWWLWTTSLVLVVSAGGLGWTENAADYSRYLPATTPRPTTFWVATLGAAVPSILLELLGAAAYVVSPKVTEVTGLPASFAGWFFWPFLILAVPQLLAINSLDMYSSGVTLQAIGISASRWLCVLIDTVISGAVTAVVIFKGSFYADLSGFLNYIVVWLAPWFGIYIVDYALRRGRYHRDSLVTGRGGLYWRDGGFHWKAVIAMLVGMVAALMWVDASSYVPSYISPLSSSTNGADLSWVLGLVVGGGLYFLLSRRSVPREREEPRPVEVAQTRG
jgi:NCS1 family nucleobase:cation symporter-1